MHHDPLDLRNMFGTALCQHAEVGSPVTRVREPAGAQGKGHFTGFDELPDKMCMQRPMSEIQGVIYSDISGADLSLLKQWAAEISQSEERTEAPQYKLPAK